MDPIDQLVGRYNPGHWPAWPLRRHGVPSLALEAVRPMDLIVAVGAPGCGKTWVAKRFVEASPYTRAIPKPIWAPDMRPEVEKIEWGEWEGPTEKENTTPYWVHGLSRPQPSERVTGRRTATWGGQRGVYDVVFDVSSWQSGYESPDGGQDHRRMAGDMRGLHLRGWGGCRRTALRRT